MPASSRTLAALALALALGTGACVRQGFDVAVAAVGSDADAWAPVDAGIAQPDGDASTTPSTCGLVNRRSWSSTIGEFAVVAAGPEVRLAYFASPSQSVPQTHLVIDRWRGDDGSVFSLSLPDAQIGPLALVATATMDVLLVNGLDRVLIYGIAATGAPRVLGSSSPAADALAVDHSSAGTFGAAWSAGTLRLLRLAPGQSGPPAFCSRQQVDEPASLALRVTPSHFGLAHSTAVVPSTIVLEQGTHAQWCAGANRTEAQNTNGPSPVAVTAVSASSFNAYYLDSAGLNSLGPLARPPSQPLDDPVAISALDDSSGTQYVLANAGPQLTFLRLDAGGSWTMPPAVVLPASAASIADVHAAFTQRALHIVVRRGMQLDYVCHRLP
ncbi:MAG: hypothetical protein KC503_32480 [Myxococcales bacterium]|nr:hypothetical protein [Myxococcales bacterium]